ncbi:MAG: hypothetical protein HY427_03715 [Candidatus Levybacteria bacterium]|nr:hypothetical protein [Candidatus Levybacteria bacterium]
MNKEIDLEADTIKVALYNSSHAFTATDNVYTTTNEITGTGYTAGGAALAGKAVTQAATTKWDANDISWTTATFTVAHGVIYDDTHATNDLIASIDFGGNQTVTTGTFTIQWHADGIITLA